MLSAPHREGHAKLIWLKTMMPFYFEAQHRGISLSDNVGLPQQQWSGCHLHVVGLFRAVRLPPAMKMAMSSAAQPEISIFTTARRVWGVESAKEPLQHQSGVVPECPAAVNLGKDLRMSIRLKSGGNVKSVLLVHGRGMAGQALLGCLLMSNFQVSSLFGATPEEVRIWQAFP